MATIHSLAPELLSDIFELAHDPHKPSTMCAASLVCRAWRDPAQRALFLDIVVTSSSSPLHLASVTVMRLPKPRRVELLATSTPGQSTHEDPALSLMYIRAAKHITITKGGPNGERFLSNAELVEGLESLAFKHCMWEGPQKASSTLLSWPRNLRALRINLQGLKVLLDARPTPGTALVSLTLEITWMRDVCRALASVIIPPSVRDLSIILAVPSDAPEFLAFFATVQNLHHLTIVFGSEFEYRRMIGTPYIRSLAGSLPASIKRLSIVRDTPDPTHPTLVLSPFPLSQIQELVSDDRLTNLTRLDFLDCKRKDLEDAAAAADLLAECERKSIRVVCWEEFL